MSGDIFLILVLAAMLTHLSRPSLMYQTTHLHDDVTREKKTVVKYAGMFKKQWWLQSKRLKFESVNVILTEMTFPLK